MFTFGDILFSFLFGLFIGKFHNQLYDGLKIFINKFTNLDL